MRNDEGLKQAMAVESKKRGQTKEILKKQDLLTMQHDMATLN